MRFLLDTCLLSELTKPEPAPRVVRWIRGADEASLRISVLTLGEIEKGIRRLPGSARRRALEEWLSEIRESYASRLLDVTAEVATEWGRLAARAEARGRSLSVVDGLIAATALVNDLAVVTRNGADMAHTGARIENPWE